MSLDSPHNYSLERRQSRQVDFTSCPSFNKPAITEDEIIKIAKKAVELAKEDMYNHVKKEFSAELGSSILGKLTYLLGAGVLGMCLWLAAHGFIKLD